MIVKLYKKMRIYKVHFRYYLIIIILLTDILETLQIKKTLQKLEKLIVWVKLRFLILIKITHFNKNRI
jgi:hypothetical protein